MRVASWNPNKFDEIFENIAMDRLEEAADVVAERASHNLNNLRRGNISRPVYKSGPNKGKNWTARNPGTLKKSVRVVRKKGKGGKAFSRKRNIRVYAGHYLAYYPYWLEYGTSNVKRKHNKQNKGKFLKDVELGNSRTPAQPFLRPAFYGSMNDIKYAIGAR